MSNYNHNVWDESVGWNNLSIPKFQRYNRGRLGIHKWFKYHTLMGMS